MYKRVKETYPKYQPHIWNNSNNIKRSHNCYAYFLNDINKQLMNVYDNTEEDKIKYLNPQPGHYCGMVKRVILSETTCDNIIERVLCDNDNIKVINSNNDNFDCGPNYYKGALAVNKGKMYHFYREDENGMWSHKDGGRDVTNLDYSGNKIDDPKYSDRGQYDEFCSYFCVPRNEYSKTNMARNDYSKQQLKYN